MVNHVSERRLVENEILSRKPNENASRAIDQLNAATKENNQTNILPEFDPQLLFFCECSNKKCKERVELSKSKYDELHQNRSQFIVKPGHNIPAIERIVQSEDNYLVVEKFIAPPTNLGIS